MLRDISTSLFKKPVTELYPSERRPTPERLRGKLVYDPDRCAGCKICVRDCPANALELCVVDKSAKRFVLRFRSDRCTFCAQCVFSCNFDAVTLSNDTWELASLSRQPFDVMFGRPEDVEAVGS